MPEGLIEKYKGWLVAQVFSQIPRIHYCKVFASTVHFAAVCMAMALAMAEDLELEAVDILMAFLNGEIDAEVYMRILEGFVVEGEPREGEDPKCWVVRLLKGLYRIKQGPCLWALKLHSVLVLIGFQRIDCAYSVYIYLDKLAQGGASRVHVSQQVSTHVHERGIVPIEDAELDHQAQTLKPASVDSQ